MRKKGISLVLCFLMVFSNLPAAFAAKNETASVAHWAEGTLASWVEKGLIHGYPDGTLRPDEALTRAEAASLVNKLFGFKVSSSGSFSDVKDNAWYADTVSAAKAAGYITGYPDGSFKPEQKVNREQFARMLAGVFKLPHSGDSVLAGFGDGTAVSAYAREAVSGLLAGGYVSGYGDHTLRPQNVITRAEAVTLLDRLAGQIVNKQNAKVPGIKSSGNVVVNVPGVTLTGADIAGDLYVAPGVGEGDLILEHSTVKGSVHINGGGQFSVYLKDSKLGKVSIEKKSPVRVVISEGSQVEDVDILTPGNRLEVGQDAVIQSLNIAADAANNEIDAEGTILEIRNAAQAVTLNNTALPTESSVKVDKGVLAAAAQSSSAPSQPPVIHGNVVPSTSPTSQPTSGPVSTPAPSPTSQPTTAPTSQPTAAPTSQPTTAPTSQPTAAPTSQPTTAPTSQPTTAPTSQPTTAPTSQPTTAPTSQPTAAPTSQPTTAPTSQPTAAPTSQPTTAPTSQPTTAPTSQPTTAPTSQPTATPTSQPTTEPPVLATDTTFNFVSQTIELSFADSAAWRSAISGITVNGVSLDAGHYKVGAGSIAFKADTFSVGENRIVVSAAGYSDSSVVQEVLKNPSEEKDWTLAWSDEFDGKGNNLDTNGVNLDKWAYQLGTGSQYGLTDWGNNEQQYYRKENVKVTDGKLVIQAKKESFEGKPYTSARLYTEPTFNKTYGKFEARIKLPKGQGLWPAFWMVPTESKYGTWASSGELDIMEVRGRLPGEVDGTIHFGEGWPNNRATGTAYHFAEGTDITDFHTYSVEWEPGEIRWYVDGEIYQILNNWDSWGKNMPAKYAFPAPFDQDFYMIMNLAVGGTYDGNREPDASQLPAEMVVDYVRAYDLTGRPYKTPVEPSVALEPLPEGTKSAINGSYVYDPGYEQGFTNVPDSSVELDTRYWNFVHMDTFGGDGAISADTVNGSKFAKIEISKPGNAVHAVQLIQNVTLGKGRWYKLSFDAKAASSRALSAKLSGGADRGWSSYSRVLEAQLGTEVQPYEMTFQMDKDSDPLARLELNMGLSPSTVWIGNVKLVETEAPEAYPDQAKEPLADGNHVYNGSFDLGRMDRMTYWHFNADQAVASASVDPEARELSVAIKGGGDKPEAVTLSQPGINLVAENKYQLTFKGRADVPREIQVAVRSKDGLRSYLEAEKVSLTETMAEKTVTFDMPEVTDPEGQLIFLLGGNSGNLVLDDISVLRLTNNNMGELPLEEQFPLKNGDFSNGTASWNEHVQGRYDGWDKVTKFSVEGGELKFHIAGQGNNPWDVMLMQNDFPLRKGNTYTVSVDARSTKSRDVEIVVDAANERYINQKVRLTPEKQTFTYELPVTADLIASFKMLLGKVEGLAVSGEHEVFVDNVRVELKGARAKAFLLNNGEFTDGLNGWDTHWQGKYDPGTSEADFDGSGHAAQITVDKTGANPWDIMLMQGDKPLEKGKTYVLSFFARSTLPRSIEAVVESTDNVRFLNEKVALDASTQHYTLEFTMKGNSIGALKFLLGKVNGEELAAHKVYLDTITLEVKGAKAATGEKAQEGNDISLPKGPVLSPDASANQPGAPVQLTFADLPAWRTAVTEVLVNNVRLPDSAYTLTAGVLTLNASVFEHTGEYTVTVKAAGFEPVSVTQSIVGESEWSLVWNDEFSGTGTQLDTNGVDLSKWAYQNGTGQEFGLDGWGNNEKQYYQRDNIKVKDGHLVIEAKEQNVGGKPYTSGRLWTNPTFTKAYGKFEARIKLPEGQGLWPAFWMMPKDQAYGTWAASGEIDIMEARGRVPNVVDGTLHYGKSSPNNKASGGHYTFPEGESFTDFHTYAVEWEPGEIRWYVDGVLFFKESNWYSWSTGQPEKNAYPAPFDEPYYMILNLAVGGNYDGGLEPPASKLPAQMLVDYVRVYELTGREYKTPVEPELVKEPIPENAKKAINGNYVYDTAYEKGFKAITPDDTLDPVYWNAVTGTGGAGAASVETIDGTPYAKMNITAGGNNDYSVQMIQKVSLVSGHYYKVSFDAKAGAARNLNVKLSGGADRAWAAYSDVFSAALKGQLENYSFIFQMTENTDLGARLEFNMGQSTLPVWIGNVKVEETEMLVDLNAPKAPLDNGDHVYNGGFELGTMDRMIFWNFAAKNDASAEASVDPATKELAVSISKPGSGPDDIQLTQKGINLLQRDSYKLTFDAKSAADRRLKTSLLSKDGGTVYAEQSYTLTPDMKTYTLEFTMAAGTTDIEAILAFGLGGELGNISLDNVRLIRTTNNNVDYSGVKLFPLVNGDFALGLEGWEPFVQGGAATFSGEGGKAKITVSNPGGEAWNVMLNQSGLPLSKGFEYVLSFDASSTVARNIEVSLENAGYTRRFETGPIDLTPETKHFAYTFRAGSDDLVALKFILGKTSSSPSAIHDIVISNVVFEIKDAPVKRPPTLVPSRTGNVVGEPVVITYKGAEAWSQAIQSVKIGESVVPASKYTVSGDRLTLAAELFETDGTYTITVEANGYAPATVKQSIFSSDGNLVYNGSMSNGKAHWDVWKNAADWSDWNVVDGVSKVDIHYDGGNDNEWKVPFSWSTQLMQEGIKLEGGKAYELSFKAWSTLDRPIVVELNGYAGANKLTYNINGDREAVYKAAITPGNATTLKLIYLLGNVDGTTNGKEHSIFIDDVAIREVKASPVLAENTTDNKVGRPITLRFADNAVWREAIQGVKINNVVVAKDQYTVSAGAIVLNAGLFSSAGSYTITVSATSYADATVVQKIKTDAENLALHKQATASSTKQPASNAFDGNAQSRWESDATDPQWIAVDLGAVSKLESIVLSWEGAFGKAYRIQTSTAAVPGEGDWKEVYTKENGLGGLEEITLNGVEARHVRLYGITRGTPYGYSLWEFEVYGTRDGSGEPEGPEGPGQPELKTAPVLTADSLGNIVGQHITVSFADNVAWREAVSSVKVDGVTLTQGYTIAAGTLSFEPTVFTQAKDYTIKVSAAGYADTTVVQTLKAAPSTAVNVALHKTASSSAALTPAALAFDGDPGTRWESEHSDNHWIAVDLGAIYLLSGIELNWEGAYAKGYRIEVSTAAEPGDGDWQTVFSTDNGVGGLEKLSLQDVQARHVRLVGTKRGLPYGYSLWEFGVYGVPQS
ncbi:hemoblobin-interacting domain-containing protein [Paenibacillus agri]|uniref:Carbohydrate binding domain-containing protein n=1 Tax=Paenibacillus agri TaxID=2744309 RepID=A0A850EW13_9BACL|nr:carbohydrate binding domain-containing protein [Paenibacillus agri]NUU63654.1 carbohydrate binding domain-containing protein [Paenibacillus agri]